MNRIYKISTVVISATLAGLHSHSVAQTVGIGATAFTPNSASILDVSSSTKGVLLPRMTTAERGTYTTNSALGVGHRGITVYNTTTNTYDYWDGAAWKVITPGALTDISAGNGLSVNYGGAFPKVELGGDLDQHTVIRGNTFNLKYVVTSTPGDGRIIVGSTTYNPNDLYSLSVQRPGEGNEVRVGGADHGLLASVDEANELGILVQNSTSSGGGGFTGAIQGIMPNMNNAEGALAFNRGGRTMGVYGSVNNGANNFAGYFEYGKVYSESNVGIGVIAPVQMLDVNGDVNVATGQGFRVNNSATSGQYLRGNGTRFVPSAIQVSDVPSGVVTADNGLTVNTGNNVRLGGTLAVATDVAQAGFDFRFTGSGSVGIGVTTAPSHKLHVAGGVRAEGGFVVNDGTAGVPAFRFNSNGTMGMFRAAANELAFSTSSTERMRIDANGNVGIGATVPTAQLHTSGTVRFANYVNGLVGVDASGNLLSRTLTTSGTGVTITNGNAVAGNPNVALNYANSSTGGTYPQGNFGQFETHGNYSDFNTVPGYWGWNYVAGTANAPNATSSQWYRGVFSLGANYPARGAGGYSLEVAYPRYSAATAGVWMRTVENGVIGSWTRIDAGTNNNNFIWNQNASAQGANYSISGNGTIGDYLSITSGQNASGNLRFSANNPYIYAPSYFVAPGGAYFNGGTVYFEAVSQHRLGIQNDGGSYSGRLRVHDDVWSNGWLRSDGSTGWYNESYGGGWFMQDATWVRSYGGKNVYVDAQLRSDGGLVSGGIGSLGGGTIHASSTIRGAGYQDYSTGYQLIDNGGGWHRSYGQTGWYNGTYGGGVWQNDANNVRVYNDKSFVVRSTTGDYHATISEKYANVYSGDYYNAVSGMRGLFNNPSYGDGMRYGVWGQFNHTYNGTFYGWRSGGVLGTYQDAGGGRGWGALGYNNSSGTFYGVYGTTGYGSGGGFAPTTEATSVGSGFYGGMMGGWNRGEVIGHMAMGELFASYNLGDEYTSGHQADIVNVGETRLAAYSVTSGDLKVYGDGTGQLNGSMVFVPFDSKFASLLGAKPTVTVSALGSPAQLYVKSIEKNGFTIACANGDVNTEFTWIAVGQRVDATTMNVPSDLMDKNFDENMKGVMFNEGITEQSATPIWWDGSKLRFDQKEKGPKKQPSYEAPKAGPNPAEEALKQQAVHTEVKTEWAPNLKDAHLKGSVIPGPADAPKASDFQSKEEMPKR